MITHRSASWLARILLVVLCLGTTMPIVGRMQVATPDLNALITPTVVINEVLANAKNESTGETIELWNVTDAPIDIAGWILGDLGDGNDVIADIQPTWDVFSTGTIIPAHGFALVVDPDAKESDHPWITDRTSTESIIIVTASGDTTIGNGLTNASDTVFVKNGAVETDRTSWTSDAGDGISWERSGASDNTWSPSGAEQGSSFGRGNNDAPIALFQCDPQDITVGQTVTCDASLSSDPEGSPLVFTWKIDDLLQPEQTHSTYSFSPTEPGEKSIGLIVSDGQADAIAEIEQITVSLVPSFSREIVISEIFANATGEDSGKEWIELLNTGDTDVDLMGWLLDDGPGGSVPYRFPAETWVRARSSLVITDAVSHLILNNSQDSVRLCAPDDSIMTEAIYQSAPENQSWALSGSTWSWTTTPTPNATNIITIPIIESDDDDVVSATSASSSGSSTTIKSKTPPAPPMEIQDLTEIGSLAIGTRVHFTAVVYALPGVISTTRIVVFRNNVPLEVSMASANFPEGLIEEDVIDVTGIIKRSKGQRYIETKEADVMLANAQSDEAPFSVSAQTIVDDTYRTLQINTPIEVHGQVVEVGSTSFKLQLPSARITIGARNLLQDEMPRLGAMTTMTGLLRKRGTSVGAELRSVSDLSIEEDERFSDTESSVPQPPRTPSWFSWALIGFAVLIFLTTITIINVLKKKAGLHQDLKPVPIVPSGHRSSREIESIVSQ